MRKLLIATCALHLVCFIPTMVMAQNVGNGLNGQPATQEAAFPWRSSPTYHFESPTIPLPPVTKASTGSAHLFGNIQDPQEPGASGNPADYTDKVPAAPNTNGWMNPTEQTPGLNTRSNATDPDLMNQQQASSWCNLGPVQRLIGTTPRGLTIGGFAQAGYHETNLPYFNTRDDRLNLHQLWTYIERPAARCSDWSVGYRVDMVYGIDGQEIQSRGNSPTGAPSGWDNGWDFGSYGAALPQAYLEFANCDWRVRAGRFLSPFGYEHVPSVENFFYSRTFTRNFTEPFGHTGVLGMYDASPDLTILAGLTAGWDTGFENTDNGFNYLGGFRYKVNPDISLSVTNSFGDTGYRGTGLLNSGVAEVKLSDKLTYVLQGDNLNLHTNQEFGITNYMFYAINPCLSIGNRVEWWKSDQIFTSSRSTWSFTSGLNYRPHANIVIRPEVRMDYGAGAIDSGDLMPALDAIFLF